MSWIDQSTDGWIVEWKPHALGQEMRFLFRDYFEYEPALHSGTGLESRLAGVMTTPKGLRWPVGTWRRLKIVPFLADGFPRLTALRDHSIAPGTWELSWAKLPPCDAVEVTPVDLSGTFGVTTRVLRPHDLPWVPFRGRFETDPYPGLRLWAAAGEGTDLSRVETAAVPLRQIGRERFRTLRSVPLPGGEGTVPLDSTFSGLVAIIARAGALTRLLDCLTVSQGDVLPRPRTKEEWRAARTRVGSGDLEVSPWPTRSAERLQKILEEAEAAGVPAALCGEIRHIQAVHRHLVLRACGVIAGVSTQEEVLGLTQAGSLRDHIGHCIGPALAASWDKIPDPSGRLWVLRNAREPDLSELLEWAAHTGGSGLEIARFLLPARRRLRALAASGDRGGARSKKRKIAELLKQVEEAPKTLATPPELERRLSELEAPAAQAG